MLNHEPPLPSIGWAADGCSFTVHDTKAFTADVLPKYFQARKWDTFVRALSKYDFTKADGSYSHRSGAFRRDAGEACALRIRAKDGSTAAPTACCAHSTAAPTTATPEQTVQATWAPIQRAPLLLHATVLRAQGDCGGGAPAATGAGHDAGYRALAARIARGDAGDEVPTPLSWKEPLQTELVEQHRLEQASQAERQARELEQRQAIEQARQQAQAQKQLLAAQQKQGRKRALEGGGASTSQGKRRAPSPALALASAEPRGAKKARALAYIRRFVQVLPAWHREPPPPDVDDLQVSTEEERRAAWDGAVPEMVKGTRIAYNYGDQRRPRFHLAMLRGPVHQPKKYKDAFWYPVKMDNGAQYFYQLKPWDAGVQWQMVDVEQYPVPQKGAEIFQGWVQCERCDCWRRLPFGMVGEWAGAFHCDMNDWDASEVCGPAVLAAAAAAAAAAATY